MRGLAILEARGVCIRGVARYRGLQQPRTEADAWREIVKDRTARGLPLTFEEFGEAGDAFKREMAKMKRRDKKELRTYECGNGHTHASKYSAKNCATCAAASADAERIMRKMQKNTAYGNFSKAGE